MIFSRARIENTAIGKELQEHWQSRRGPQKRLSLSETVTLNMIRFYVRLIDLKSFHRLARNEYGRYFPQLPNYENFLKASNCSMAAVAVFSEYLLQLNRTNSTDNTYFIDATALSVCHNEHISSHKVTKGFAQRGKTTKGWFYGFKLHGVCKLFEFVPLLQLFLMLFLYQNNSILYKIFKPVYVVDFF